VGNVTIPANYDIPEAGQLVEIRYLYWYKDGSLYQPQYEGPRLDCDWEDCGIEKLKIFIQPT
jgi:bifunctional non-homologous end joining protein LigD